MGTIIYTLKDASGNPIKGTFPDSFTQDDAQNYVLSGPGAATIAQGSPNVPLDKPVNTGFDILKSAGAGIAKAPGDIARSALDPLLKAVTLRPPQWEIDEFKKGTGGTPLPEQAYQWLRSHLMPGDLPGAGYEPQSQLGTYAKPIAEGATTAVMGGGPSTTGAKVVNAALGGTSGAIGEAGNQMGHPVLGQIASMLPFLASAGVRAASAPVGARNEAVNLIEKQTPQAEIDRASMLEDAARKLGLDKTMFWQHFGPNEALRIRGESAAAQPNAGQIQANLMAQQGGLPGGQNAAVNQVASNAQRVLPQLPGNAANRLQTISNLMSNLQSTGELRNANVSATSPVAHASQEVGRAAMAMPIIEKAGEAIVGPGFGEGLNTAVGGLHLARTRAMGNILKGGEQAELDRLYAQPTFDDFRNALLVNPRTRALSDVARAYLMPQNQDQSK
jgi:hypothetical protein